MHKVGGTMSFPFRILFRARSKFSPKRSWSGKSGFKAGWRPPTPYRHRHSAADIIQDQVGSYFFLQCVLLVFVSNKYVQVTG